MGLGSRAKGLWQFVLMVVLVLGGAMLDVAPARAANDCGPGPTATCTSAGNTYPNGISYSAINTAQSVTLQSGVVVTPNSGVAGVVLSDVGTGIQTVDAAAGSSIETTGDNAGGIRVSGSLTGAISITSASVITHGNTTLLNGAAAIRASTSGSGAAGNITIDASQGVGLLETFGSTSQGVQAQSTGGAIDITVGTVRTQGDGSTAIDALIVGGTGNLTVKALGNITVTGPDVDSFGGLAGGISAVTQGSGAVSVTTKDVSTVANTAVFAQSSGGKVSIDTSGGTVSTTGDFASGITATFSGSSGDASITTAGVSTSGAFSDAVDGFTGGPNASLTIDTTAGTITSTQDNGINARTGNFPGTANAGTLTIRSGNINAVTGIVASANGGAIDITAGGAITTSGDGISTQNGTASGIVVTTIDVTGSIVASGSHGISASIVSGGHNAITVSGSITASAGTGILSSGSGDSVIVTSTGAVSGRTGIQFSDTGTSTLTNSGIITGTGTNAVLFSGSADSFTNDGTVNGNVSLGNGNDTARLDTGSTITGTMNAGNGTDTLKLGGAGTGTLDMAKVTNFESAQKLDAGTWTLTTSSGTGLNGTFTVSAGRLSVNGTTTSTTYSVASGATLGGIGTLGATTILAGGTHAPGNSIGTETINGNYVNSGTLQIEVSPTAADKVVVNGSVNITGANLVLLESPATGWDPTHDYTIIDNDGVDPVTGTFASVTDNFAFLDPTITYAGGTGNDVVLTITRNALSFSSAALTPNEIAAAGGAESLGGGNPVYDAILPLSASQAPAAFDQLSGEIYADLAGVVIADSRTPRQAALDRVDAAFAALADQKRSHGRSFWTQTVGDAGVVLSDRNAADLDVGQGGFLAGTDEWLSNALFAGGELGATFTGLSVPDRSSSASIESLYGSLYGGLDLDPVRLGFGATLSAHSAHVTRNPSFAGFTQTLQSDTAALSAQLFGEIGYAFRLDAVELEPFAGLALIHGATSPYAESGGSAALSGPGAGLDAAVLTAGLRGSTDLVLPGDVKAHVGALLGLESTLAPTPMATHSFTGGSAFTVAAAPFETHAVLGGSLTIDLPHSAELDVDYRGTFGAGGRSRVAHATLSGHF